MKRNFSASLRGKNVLVTGDSGFIGSHVVRRLVESGAAVHAFSAPMNRKDQKTLPGFKSVKIYRGSLTDSNQLKKIVSKIRPSKIVHMAAVVNLDRSFEIARECFRTNIEGTLNLLEALKSVSFEQFVFLSTAEVYGNGKIPFTEGQREFPPSPYAISKLAGEQLCQMYGRISNYPVCVLRVSTCYGPGQNKERIVPSIIQSCLKSRPIKVSRGDIKRDFIYAEDAAEGILKALVSPNSQSEVINLGSEESYSVSDLIKEIKRITRSNSPVFYGSVPRRKFETTHWSSSASKAKKLLGWEARTPLKAGLEKTISWYKENL